MTHAGFLERFLERSAHTPDAVAVEDIDNHVVFRFVDLLERMERMRATLMDLGVGEGERVLLMLPSGADFIVAFYSVASLSAIAVPVSPTLTAFELEPILRDASPCGAIVASEFLPPALPRGTSLRFVRTAADCTSRRIPLQVPSADSVVSCHFTYKGLGYPLGVLHRYASYSTCLSGMLDQFVEAPDGPHLAVLPQYPIYALLATVMLPLALGARAVIAPRSGPRRMFDLLEQHQIRIACLVPMLYQSLSAERRLGPKLHPHLALVSGGSYLTPELAEAVRLAIGVEPLQGYGLTETLPIISNSPHRRRSGALGMPLHPDVRVRIVNAFGRDSASGQVGEIAIAGPTVTPGFIGRPAETRQFLRDGWFFTGDLGHLDADGFLHFTGRALRLTKRASQMVDLAEIEHVIRRHPAVVDARATVGRSSHGAERVGLTVLVGSRTSLTQSEVIEHCKQYLSTHKLPRSVQLVQRGDIAA